MVNGAWCSFGRTALEDDFPVTMKNAGILREVFLNQSAFLGHFQPLFWRSASEQAGDKAGKITSRNRELSAATQRKRSPTRDRPYVANYR